MSKTLPNLSADWLQCDQSVALLAMFTSHGYTARFVGGVVRNALLGEPVGDLDMATDAPPQTVMEMAQEAGFKAIGTGLEHGTVTVVVAGRVYEITTLRVDVETDGRHASVAFTDDWYADAARRDFTMNALYVDGDGTLFDPLDGFEDLMARRVRFIGNADERIREDYLRILRFFRFSAQYGEGQVDKKGLAACMRLQSGLATLSRERIRSELVRLLLMPAVVEVLDVMFGHGLLLPLMSRVPHMARLKNWLKLENGLEFPRSAIHRLGALNMLVKEDADHLAEILRLSNEEKYDLKLWTRDCGFHDGLSEKQAHVLLYRSGEDYQIRVAINWLLSGADRANAAWRSLYDLPYRWSCPRFPLKGQDLLKQGMSPGPLVGKRLLMLERIWIDSDFKPTRDELLQQLKVVY